MPTRRWQWSLLLGAVFAACESSPEPIIVVVTPTPIEVAVSAPTAQPTPAQTSPTVTSSPVHAPALQPAVIHLSPLAPKPTPALTSTPARVVSVPAGIVYSDESGIWLVESASQPRKIIDNPRALLSPDRQWTIYRDCNCGDQAILMHLTTGYTRTVSHDLRYAVWSPDSRSLYYTLPDENRLTDIWVEDVATGLRRKLTKTSNLYESQLLIWSPRPEVLVFYTTPGFPDGAGWIGYLTVTQADGSNYEVVSREPVSSPAALSPDGYTIAYATYGEETSSVPWYYRLGSQPKRFPWQDFGLAGFKNMGFSSPSWSNDGRRIAWWMWSYDDNHQQKFRGIGLFDLEAGKVTLLDNFFQMVPDGWPQAVEWGADGKRIVFFGGRQQSESFGDWGEFGIWTADADGSHVRHLIGLHSEWNPCDWAWQPDGGWLAFNCRHTDLAPGIWLVEIETGRLLKTNLPPGAEVRDWIRFER